jgi:pimeloyl-ACP methyl ester carboxylesterase
LRSAAVEELDLALDDDRTLHVYDRGPAGALALFWHHGTPNLGPPPRPLFAAADRLGLRWVSHDRPGYGGSTPQPGRDIASAASDVAAVADVGFVLPPSGRQPSIARQSTLRATSRAGASWSRSTPCSN